MALPPFTKVKCIINVTLIHFLSSFLLYPNNFFGHFSDVSNHYKITLIINFQISPAETSSVNVPLVYFHSHELTACLSIIGVTCAWSCVMFPQEEQSEWHVSLVLGITPHKPNDFMCTLDKQSLAHCHIYRRQSEFRSVINGCFTYATLWKPLLWPIAQRHWQIIYFIREGNQ